MARADACTTQTFGDMTVDVEGRELVANKAGKTLVRHELPEGVTPRGEWVLRQSDHGDGPARIEADRTWRLEEQDWGVDVILDGPRRIGIEPQ